MMIHELTHASQVRRLEMEKGTRWVAEYWSINAKKQLNNTIFKGGNPYGNKGDNNWQQTALSEGWGYFMEWRMSTDLLPKYKDTIDNGFPYEYGTMFQKLQSIGCSIQSMEKNLGAYSLVEFRNNLIRYYPYLENQIKTIIKEYE